MKIGISGASGHLGKTVIAKLLQRGGEHEVVAISRTPEGAPDGVQSRYGNYDEPDGLREAYAGLDRLLLIPSADLEPGKRAVQLVAAIDAARRSGVPHIVLMSAAGTKRASDAELGSGYWKGEQHLIVSAHDWTILRMSYYAEALADEARASLAGGVLTGLAENRVSFVSRDDVAAAAAGILVSDGHDGAIYHATGEQPVSGAERAALIAEITGRPINFLVLPEEKLHAGLSQAGLPEPVVNAVIDIQKSFIRGAFDIVTGDVERLSGRPPKGLRDILATQLFS
ncbi:SDR family oxidoreductase [Agrobacterium larrymoorei]|uniref:SDR family oxidoreductase n=1 Tax=Agrobacterium larrymoorei TaxID=160699 RepID=A0A4D7E048_9HYPH|nr:SDR family oxidoreductase [Agrobacterium larrymoorei]QCJ00928.1 SDR family oxidoreductase [Agrobacterium larrymoorei]QYA10262.1 SDR family oxidoreductase [Agrobacterium larrymoorei]